MAAALLVQQTVLHALQLLYVHHAKMEKFMHQLLKIQHIHAVLIAEKHKMYNNAQEHVQQQQHVP